MLSPAATRTADPEIESALDLSPDGTTSITATQDVPHLAHGLDTELPDQLAPGKGIVLPLRGYCYSIDAPLRALDVLAGHQTTPVPNHSWGRTDIFAAHVPGRDPSGHSLLSGFDAFVPLGPVTIDTTVPLRLRATLADGRTAERSLGTIRLLAGHGAEPRPLSWNVTWPGTGPRVAICMATFRPPIDLFLAQIASIRAQTHTNWVCLLSDDNTENEDYDRLRFKLKGDDRFIFIQNRNRLGFYGNFEGALRRTPADAEFVALCDQDDVWHPDKLATLLAAFTPATQLAYSDARLVAEDGSVQSDTFWTGRRNNYTDLSTLMVANTVTGAASMLRASLLPDILPFPIQVGPAFHDHWIGLVALLRGGIAYVDRPLYDYVQHGSGVIGHNYHRWPGTVSSLLAVVRAGPRRSDMAKTASLALRQALDDYQFVLQKVVLARTLLLRNPDLPAAPRAVLDRFARFETSLGAATAEKFAALRTRRPTLNLEGLYLWTMLGTRLRNAGLKLKQRALTRQQTANPGRRLLGAIVDTKPAPGQPVALSDAEKPHPWYPDNIPALMFGTTRWIHHNILPLTLDISPSHPKRVNILLATINFSYVFGGYIGMFNLALRLQREGYRARIIVHENTEWDMEDWRRKIQKYPGITDLFERVEVISRWDRAIPVETSPDDRFVATNCWAAHIAHNTAKSFPETRFLFMAQEYEPFFMAMNSISALFQQAYDLPQVTLYSTELLREYFRRERIGIFAGPGGDASAMVFSNAIQTFHPTRALMSRPERRLLFYARYEEHAARNLFELGMIAIARLVRDPRVELTGWSFHGIGSLGGNMLDLKEGVPLELVPKTSLEEYIRMMPSFDVGLSLMMTPHPSLVPIEMASAGMWTVTNTFANKTAESLAAISSNLIGVAPTVEAIVDGLVEAMRRVDRIDDRLAGARVNWPTTWDAAYPPQTIARIHDFLGDPNVTP